MRSSPMLPGRAALFAALLATLVPVAVHAAPTDSALTAAVAAPDRTPTNRARDAFRHPAQTLAFFGLKPGMTVVEISPQGGYFTEVLVPAIGPTGHLYAAWPDPAGEAREQANIDKVKAKYVQNPRYANVTLTYFGKGGQQIAPSGSADMVVTFRNVHNWIMEGFAPQAFQEFYAALRHGGVLGLEEHRLPESRTTDLDGSKGYVKQSAVIAMAQAAGFKLVASSEINANSNDTADYPKGVWTLPPNYAEGDKNRAHYAAVGESDRMTLKFVKP